MDEAVRLEWRMTMTVFLGIMIALNVLFAIGNMKQDKENYAIWNWLAALICVVAILMEKARLG